MRYLMFTVLLIATTASAAPFAPRSGTTQPLTMTGKPQPTVLPPFAPRKGETAALTMTGKPPVPSLPPFTPRFGTTQPLTMTGKGATQ